MTEDKTTWEKKFEEEYSWLRKIEVEGDMFETVKVLIAAARLDEQNWMKYAEAEIRADERRKVCDELKILERPHDAERFTWTEHEIEVYNRAIKDAITQIKSNP